MLALRNPLLPVGLLLVIMGLGNWYTGINKGAEYEQLLANTSSPAAAVQFDDFRELNARTTATLLSPLRRGSDERRLISAKLDFYRVVQSGGRIFILLGLFCTAAGLIRSWYRRHLSEREPAG